MPVTILSLMHVCSHVECELVIEELDMEPTTEDLGKAINSLPCRKVPGSDGITAEVLKYGKPALLHKLHKLFCLCWRGSTGFARLKTKTKVRPLIIRDMLTQAWQVFPDQLGQAADRQTDKEVNRQTERQVIRNYDYSL